jgi:hypothetical protein
MTQDEVNKLSERVAWLERKMIRVIWLLSSAISAFIGFMIAHNVDPSHGWPSIVLGSGIWIALAFITNRQELKGAPQHIRFIDP